MTPDSKDTFLQVGDKIPDISLPDQNGVELNLGSLKGEPFILYFYPKDNTPGCTKEACSFRDNYSAFTGAGIKVIGVSPDSANSHVKFIEKFDIPFTLLTDKNHELMELLGAWGTKVLYGRESVGVKRSTFLIGADGMILEAWRNVRVAGHVEKVLGRAKNL